MRLYAGMSDHFIEDTTRNQIAEKLREAFFFEFRYEPSMNEVKSWSNSLRAFAQVLTSAKLFDHGILLEYQIPLTSLRLDAMISGFDAEERPNAVVVELKQWDTTHPSDGPNEVLTYVGGRQREVLHPSVQAGRYRTFLSDIQTVFDEESENAIALSACSYLHNYPFDKADPIFEPKFSAVMSEVPLFCMDDVPKMRDYLKSKLIAGKGAELLNRIEESEYRPTRKLMDHIATVIEDHSDYVLMDEQLIVYDKIVSLATDQFHSRNKATIIVKGGPGTGKSVIALNVMADLLRKGMNAQYATGSKAFTETLRDKIGARGSTQFKYFNSYMTADRDQVDVLICDEAHRIRVTSNNRFTPKPKRSKMPQVAEILQTGRITVFFIDDIQVVRPDEIGSVHFIREEATKLGHDIHEYELDVQFRCAGSEGFVNWIDNTLAIRKTPNIIWTGNENFDFQIFATPEELDKAIRAKASGNVTARMTAGFCWPWSDPLPDGTLVNDVAIGEYQRPWNARSDAGKLAPGIPKESLWATSPGGVDQVGCVYTAQGFEFDFVGVIVGRDLVYSFPDAGWVGVKEESFDRAVKRTKGIDDFMSLVKNTYRVLLTRGMKGCYVCFLDKGTEAFFRSRMEARAPAK